MAEANERFVILFPDAQDVERLLFESAKYYKQSGNKERALKVFKRYIQTYPQYPRAIEARFQAGLILKETGAISSAVAEWNSAIDDNERQKRSGGKGNDYYAAEAAFSIAAPLEEEFESIRMSGTGKNLEASRKRKSESLQKTIAAYQKVILYKTTRIFEATYKMGKLYENFAESFSRQERPKVDNPLKKSLSKRILPKVPRNCWQSHCPLSNNYKIIT